MYASGMQFKQYLFIINMQTEIPLTPSSSPSIAIPITGPLQVDQSTQASFPVLLRSQQKALKRYATLAEIKTPKYPPSSTLWAPQGYINNGFQGSTQNLSHTRAKSLHLNVDYNLVGAKASRLSTLNLATIEGQRHKLSTLNLAQNVESPRSRLSTMNSSNTLSPKQYYGESPTSYAGSDVSYNNPPIGESVIYSGQFKTVHQSKWKIGPDQPDTLSLSKTMCSCCHNPKELRHTNTPEGLSWRRLHMSRAKLKATATTSELLSGFAMVAMVELQINEPTTVPEWLFVLFAVCTTILVAVHIFALMISTYILPNIDAISKLDVCELVTESPHERMRGFIELAWAFSTVLGLFLFLVEIAILCWVKFWDYSFTAAIAATVIVIPVLVMFVAFAVHFYHSLVVYKCDSSDSDIQQLENMKKELDLATSPV